MKLIKKVALKICQVLELFINLVIYGYGPFAVYDNLVGGEHLTGTIFAMAIGVVAYMDYRDERVRNTVMGHFFNLMMLWEGIKNKYKLGDYRD